MIRIRTRIFIVFVLLTGAGFYYLVDWILKDLRPRYLEAVEETMVDTAHLLAAMLENQLNLPSNNGEPDLENAISRLQEGFERAYKRDFQARIYELTKSEVDLIVYITDSTGKVLYHSVSPGLKGADFSQWRDVNLTLKGEYGARSTRSNPSDPSSSTLYVSAPVKLYGEIIGVLSVGKPTDSVNLFLQTAQPKLILAGLIAALSVMGLGYLLLGWVIRPIRKMTEYARDVRDGKNVPMPKLGRSEIQDMAVAMEEMKQALEGKKYVEEYVHNLTHELKSPISSIRATSELLSETMTSEKKEKFLKNIQNESLRMQDLVERMLRLADLEHKQALAEWENVDFLELTQKCINNLQIHLNSKNVTVSIPGSSFTLNADPLLLQQALENLLYNAIDFSPNHTTIQLNWQITGHWAEIFIHDVGPGIPEYAEERIFEKFYSLPRPMTGKKGTGLGLAFVKEITRLHQGEISAQNHPEGGLLVHWKLPVNPGNFT